jgi:hypothetical protein
MSEHSACECRAAFQSGHLFASTPETQSVKKHFNENRFTLMPMVRSDA